MYGLGVLSAIRRCAATVGIPWGWCMFTMSRSLRGCATHLQHVCSGFNQHACIGATCLMRDTRGTVMYVRSAPLFDACMSDAAYKLWMHWLWGFSFMAPVWDGVVAFQRAVLNFRCLVRLAMAITTIVGAPLFNMSHTSLYCSFTLLVLCKALASAQDEYEACTRFRDCTWLRV